MFSRPQSDLLLLESGHPHISSAMVFDREHLLRIEAVWIDGMGLPDRLDADCLERILISARSAGYVLDIGDRRTARLRDGSFRESLRAEIDLPDPMLAGGKGVDVKLVLGHDPALATELWDAEAMRVSLEAWGQRSLAAVRARVPDATVSFSPASDQRMDIDLSRLRGEALRLRPMRREVFRLVADAGLVRQ